MALVRAARTLAHTLLLLWALQASTWGVRIVLSVLRYSGDVNTPRVLVHVEIALTVSILIYN